MCKFIISILLFSLGFSLDTDWQRYGNYEISLNSIIIDVGSVKNKSIKVIEIQRQGKRPQNINEFMLGSQIKKGSSLNNA
jgi:hypothetical protein